MTTEQQKANFAKFIVASTYIEFLALSLRGLALPWRIKNRVEDVIRQTGFLRSDIEKHLASESEDDLYDDATLMDRFLTASLIAEQTGRGEAFKTDFQNLIDKYKIDG